MIHLTRHICSLCLISTPKFAPHRILFICASSGDTDYLRGVAAWVPFFDDMNAIIFLAPVSCFDQVLMEDQSVNRLVSTFPDPHTLLFNIEANANYFTMCLSVLNYASTVVRPHA